MWGAYLERNFTLYYGTWHGDRVHLQGVKIHRRWDAPVHARGLWIRFREVRLLLPSKNISPTENFKLTGPHESKIIWTFWNWVPLVTFRKAPIFHTPTKRKEWTPHLEQKSTEVWRSSLLSGLSRLLILPFPWILWREWIPYFLCHKRGTK